MQKRASEAQQPGNIASHALISYKKVEAIFGASPLEGTTLKKKDIYIDEARKTNYPTVLTVDHILGG